MAADDPIERFAQVYARAGRGAPYDASAVALATADEGGRPSARMVLLKGFDGAGFRFFTNYESRKARELDANPYGALCFYWPWLDEQVRVEGEVERLPAAESDAYFASRPRGSQLGAWASAQSRPLESRFALLRRVARAQARFLGVPIARPSHWGGFLLRPERIEFWVSKASRLHERTLYTRSGERWETTRLQP
jgi:pyridoxamine 5'-phosphate oxidase